ncbi:MAG: hypothetical protein U9N49_07340, partial [Campylobacterota bacterium]|nr:hypothetical protein [Campylobacterota bacterium]
ELIATNRVEIASIDVDLTKDNELYISDDSNTSLAGTQIIIPKGSMLESTTIKVKKSDINAIPSKGSIGISDVLSLEPSGLTFDEPIQIRIPYNSNLDINTSNLKIARYSKDGTLDYISPLFIDENLNEVVFETEHFTDFRLVEWNYNPLSLFEKSNEHVIEDIEKITGLTNYSNDEWVEILNAKLGSDDSKLSVYDMYLKYKSSSSVSEKIKSRDYIGAYKDSFPSVESIKETGEFLGEYSKFYVLVKNTKELEDDFEDWKGKADDYTTYTKNTVDALLFKKYYPATATLFGLIPKENPIGIITDYVTYIQDTAFQALEMIDDNFRDIQIEKYFILREKYSREQIEEELEKSFGFTNSLKYFGGDGGYAMKNGWFDAGNANSSNVNTKPPYFYWHQLEYMFVANQNYKKIADTSKYEPSEYEKEHTDTLINLISDVKISIDNKGEYISINRSTLQSDDLNIELGNSVKIVVKPDISSSLDYELTLKLKKIRYGNTPDDTVETIILERVEKESKKSYEFNVIPDADGKSNYYVETYVRTVGENQISDYDLASNSISVNVKKAKREVEIVSMDLQANINEDGSCDVRFAPRLNILDNVPFDLELNYADN